MKTYYLIAAAWSREHRIETPGALYHGCVEAESPSAAINQELENKVSPYWNYQRMEVFTDEEAYHRRDRPLADWQNTSSLLETISNPSRLKTFQEFFVGPLPPVPKNEPPPPKPIHFEKPVIELSETPAIPPDAGVFIFSASDNSVKLYALLGQEYFNRAETRFHIEGKGIVLGKGMIGVNEQKVPLFVCGSIRSMEEYPQELLQKYFAHFGYNVEVETPYRKQLSWFAMDWLSRHGIDLYRD